MITLAKAPVCIETHDFEDTLDPEVRAWNRTARKDIGEALRSHMVPVLYHTLSR